MRARSHAKSMTWAKAGVSNNNYRWRKLKRKIKQSNKSTGRNCIFFHSNDNMETKTRCRWTKKLKLALLLGYVGLIAGRQFLIIIQYVFGFAIRWRRLLKASAKFFKNSLRILCSVDNEFEFLKIELKNLLKNSWAGYKFWRNIKKL